MRYAVTVVNFTGQAGWAQVNGRNAITWEEKFAHDAWYADHQSLWLDRCYESVYNMMYKAEHGG